MTEAKNNPIGSTKPTSQVDPEFLPPEETTQYELPGFGVPRPETPFYGLPGDRKWTPKVVVPPESNSQQLPNNPRFIGKMAAAGEKPDPED